MLLTLFVIVTFAALYWFPIRRWMSHWGTTPSDRARVMAGDGLLVDPTYSGTMAVIVNARPEADATRVAQPRARTDSVGAAADVCD